MPKWRVAVLGAGTMGAGIAQIAAQNGYDVLMCDVKEEFVQRSLKTINDALSRRVAQGKLDAGDMKAAISRISTTTTRDDLAKCSLIIEAAPEELALKQEIFRSLSSRAEPGTILATNTSSLSVTSLGAAATDPTHVVGLHFFNPAPAMPLVEVIAGSKTSPTS